MGSVRVRVRLRVRITIRVRVSFNDRFMFGKLTKFDRKSSGRAES